MTEREKRFIDERFPTEEERLDAYRRLEAHEPLAYILGEWYFYDEKYIVSPAVLVPQPDTELLVENAIKLVPHDAVFLDLCTGSGCIAVSLLCHRPDLRAVALDISEEALEIACRNAELNGVSDRISFVRADLFVPDFTSRLPQSTFSALLSNPPYIVHDIIETLDAEVRAEPHIALDGGADGLDFYRRIEEIYRGILEVGSPLLLEIGYDQAEAVKKIFNMGMVRRDYGGCDRLFIGIR